MAEDSPATFEPLFRAQWPDADSKGATQRADETTAAVLRLAQSRSFFAGLIGASIVLHLAALAALVWLEHAPPLKPDAALEIPVDLVTAPPEAKPSGGSKGDPHGTKPGKPKPAASKADTSKGSTSKPAVAPKSEASKPPQAKPPEPKTEVKPSPPKLEPPKPQPAPAPPPKPEVAKPEALKLEAPKPEPPKPAEAVKPVPPVQPPPPLPVVKPQPANPPPPLTPSGSPEGRTEGLMQDNSRAVAMPQPTADGDEAVNYQTLVFGMLELNKEFPEDARRRGAYGTALVAFELNDDGTVKNEKLLRSSGDAALDVESLALVQRAAPFPKPPPGAQKVFAADITFPAPK